MSTGRVVALVAAGVVLLVAVGLLIGGGVLTGACHRLIDRDGFLTLPAAEFARDTYALTGHARFEGDWAWWWRHPTTIRVRMTSPKPLFIGIAARSDIERYLADAPYAEVRRIEFDHFRSGRAWTAEYRDRIGPSAPAQPAEQPFWRAGIEGTGTQTLTWTIEPGDWMLVVMNADASRGIEVAGTVAVRAPWLPGVGIGLLVGGAILLAIGVGIVVLVGRRSRGAVHEEPAGPAPSTGFPLTFRAELTEPLSPVLWLVKWFLLIPHFVVLPCLWLGFAAAWVIALISIVFRGRYPRALFDYNVGVMRWTWRVAFYGYQGLATDRYPPFTLRGGGYPADLDVAYPARLSSGLALVKWWLLAIPHYIVVGVFQGGGGFYSWGLVPILAIFAGAALLFTGRYPGDIFRLILRMNRWTFRVLAYAALMTDRYPPFRLEG